MNRLELQAKIDEYMDTLDDIREDEWVGTPYDLTGGFLSNFTKWLYKEEDAKEARRQQYLALKQEFEGINREPPPTWYPVSEHTDDLKGRN